MAEAQVAQEVVEVLSDSAEITMSTYVPQLPAEVLSHGLRISNATYIPQFPVEVLSKENHINNVTYLPQLAIEVLSKSFTRWTHNLAGVPNANIASVINHNLDAFSSVVGVT